MEDIVEEQASDINGRIGGVAGTKVNLFGQFVDENGDGVVSMCSPGELNNEVH